MNSGADNRSLRIGERIADKYVVQRQVASGGMGEVWVALNEATRASVALKVVHAEAARDQTVRARLEQEARIGATLGHRHIVRVFDLVKPADGSLVVVMELLKGESLADYLKRRGKLDAHEAVSVLAPVLVALGFVHERGVLHRDVKPANIFLALEPDGSVIPKLVDFGIAKADARGLTLSGDVLGTPQYLAPERIRGQRDLDRRSDLFSVGAVLYELLTGAPPFDGPLPSATLAAVLEQDPEPHETIDPRLWLVIKRALAKQPYERQANAEEMLREMLETTGTASASTTVVLPDVQAFPIPSEMPAALSERVPLTEFGPSTLSASAVQADVRKRSPRRSRVVATIALLAGALVGVGLAGLFVSRKTEPTAPLARAIELHDDAPQEGGIASPPTTSETLANSPASDVAEARPKTRGAAARSYTNDGQRSSGPEPRGPSTRGAKAKGVRPAPLGRGTRPDEIGTSPGF